LLPKKVFDVVTSLVEKGLRITVGISLDGVGDNHDVPRGVKGNFIKVEKLINDLNIYISNNKGKNRFEIEIGVGSMVTPETSASIKEVINYSNSKGISFLPQMYEEFTYYSSYDADDKNSTLNQDIIFGNAIDDKSITKEFYKDFKMIEKESDRKIMLDAVEKVDKKMQYEVLHKCITDKPLKFQCGSMTRFFLLHHDGSVSPCLKYAHIRTGNVKEGGYFNVMDSKESCDARKLVANCRGCSNSWATSWSLTDWIFPFIPMILRSRIRRLF